MSKSKKFISAMVISFSIALLSLAQWSNDPVWNTAIAAYENDQALPKTVSHASGITYISWFSIENGNYSVRLQRLDVQGNKLWAENGLLVSNHPSMTWLTDYDLAVDHEGCAVIVFQDIRNGYNNVYAYRISPSGEFLWGPDGLTLSRNTDFNPSPVVTITKSGNAVFAWARWGETVKVMMQKVSPYGRKVWGEEGIQLSGPEDFVWPYLVPSLEDDVILVWFKQTGAIWSPEKHIYAQRFDASGGSVWTDDVPIATAGEIPVYAKPAVETDRAGGVAVAWYDDWDRDNVFETYVQHLDGRGIAYFQTGGLRVALTPGIHHLDPALAFHPLSGELSVFWCDRSFNQGSRGISGQRLSLSGERLWGEEGKVIIPMALGDRNQLFVRSADALNVKGTKVEEHIAVFFADSPSDQTRDCRIIGLLVDREGKTLWRNEKVAISIAAGEKLHMEVGRMNSYQYIVTWEDRRMDNGDVYAQNIHLDGELGNSWIP